MGPQAFEATVKGAIDIPWEFSHEEGGSAATANLSVFEIQVICANSRVAAINVGCGSAEVWDRIGGLDEVLFELEGFLDQVACDLSRIRNKKILEQSLETMKFSQETRATIEELIANLSNES